jgi:predicted DNA-binding protein
MNTPTLSVRVPQPLREQLEELALQDRRPLSNFVRLVLQDYAETQRREEPHRDHRAA